MTQPKQQENQRVDNIDFRVNRLENDVIRKKISRYTYLLPIPVFIAGFAAFAFLFGTIPNYLFDVQISDNFIWTCFISGVVTAFIVVFKVRKHYLSKLKPEA
ncbi:MAG: DUF3087 family protein [Flavobacteriales bacterium]